MASIIGRIEELSREREKLLKDEGEHRSDPETAGRLERVDHRLRVLWDLRRRELAGEKVEPGDDFLDEYDRYGGRETPPSA
ncbi:DUF2630 family protein [Rubrobacter indicoceani]|uniref:DUF2630 family protein n=1 Tax=Rubrobacter indicoceani TaxID=2051957 RepID=UPI000E5B4B85|nr:DUF2630 family protein [Rubrobacter indicoceani]